MLVLEFKTKGKTTQFRAVDEAIRTAQFVRNKCLRYWMDSKNVSRAELYRYNTQLRAEYDFVKPLNSHACQASVERCWSGIARFFDNCKKKIKGKKGYPKFKKNARSVEYKTSGWKLSNDRSRINFTDDKGIGQLKLVGTRDLDFYQPEQVKRVRLVRRADGYYCQFLIQVDRVEDTQPTSQTVGIDVGLNHFYTDSQGNTVENPRHLRKAEKALKRHHRRVSKKKKGSRNRRKAINRLGRKHLKVSRRRKDFAVKTARALTQSNDVVVYEDLRVTNLVKNRHLAKSISDAAWSQFRQWLEYYAKVFGRIVIAVPPHYTSQRCSSCGEIVKKTLSQRTHLCRCGCTLDRDHNAALNILKVGLNTVGHTEIQASGEISLYTKQETDLLQVISLNEESPRL